MRGLVAKATGALLAAGVVVVAVPVYAAAVDDDSSRMQAVLPQRLASPTLVGEMFAHVRDAKTGEVVFAASGSVPALPASTLKVLTAVAALSVMPADHRMTTRVLGDGNGVTLVGGGDPLLSGRDLDILAAKTAQWWLAEAGPAAVLSVAVDDGLFGSPTAAPGWEPPYQPIEVPPVRALARHGDRSWDASRRATARFVSKLKAAGVRVNFVGRRAAEGGSLVAQRWHTLDQAVHDMLLRSDNFTAEVLFRQAALAVGADPASWGESSRAVTRTLELAGVDTSGLRMVDGSGLSRENRVTGAALTSALALAADPTRRELAPIYFGGALPLAGKTGTLGPGSGRYQKGSSACARGKVSAKTGTLHDVISLAGITQGTDGVVRAFSFVLNQQPSTASDRAARGALDALAATVHGCW